MVGLQTAEAGFHTVHNVAARSPDVIPPRADAAIDLRRDHHILPRDVSVDGRVMVDDPDLAVRAAVDGLGIAYTIEALAEPFLRSGQLVRVLEDWSPTLEGLFLYYPGRRQVPATLRALIDMIRSARGKPGKGLLKNPFTKS
jgi:DNA-binding transcriptional LysR family regulator